MAMTKLEELESGCISRAADDEPVFVLRAQDKFAPAVIRSWAALAKDHGCSHDKIDEALAVAKAMEEWPNRKNPD